MDRHQAEWLCQQRVRPRFTNQLVVEGPPIKRLMLGSDGREKMIGTEVSGRQHAKPECGIR